MTTHFPVLVIGAGQAGLSVSYFLQKFGLAPGKDFLILDRGPATGGAWQFRWDHLRLGLTHRVHNLPGMEEIGLDFAAADRGREASEVVGEYYQKFEDHYNLQVRRPVLVDSVSALADGRYRVHAFQDHTTPEVFTADVLVNATGTWFNPRLPEFNGIEDFGGQVIHAQEFTRAPDFAGRKVAIVGGGITALEFVGELLEPTSQLHWFTRRPVEFLSASAFNQDRARAAVAFQDQRIQQGLPTVSVVSATGFVVQPSLWWITEQQDTQPEPMFTRLLPGGAERTDGSVAKFDTLLLATGFDADIAHLEPLGLTTEHGAIAARNGQALEDPNLFLAGYGPQASTIGANRAGRSIARQVMRRLAARQRTESQLEPGA